MENVTCVTWLCCCLLITTATDGQPIRDVRIENCNSGFIDIRENANNKILCTGFFPNDTIVWTFKRDDEASSREVATCDQYSNCTILASDRVSVQRSPRQSTLFYQRLEVDKVATITCASWFENKRSWECKLNVINPATLSRCAVEEDRVRGTVRGRCRFDNAYSLRRQFTCTWYQENGGQSRQFHANIEYDSGPQSPGGVCTFSSKDLAREPGTYTYSIDFYPGPRNFSVNIGNLETTGTNSVPAGAIAGGIVAAVGIIVVVVVVVVVIRRKRRQKPAGSPDGSGDVASTDNNDFEEHVNPMYVTSDVPDDTHSTDHKPSAIALRSDSNSHNGHPAAPHSLETDMYTTVDGEARYAPNSAADRSGGYEDIGLGNNGNKRVPQKDEYAVVDKSRAKKGPASSANTSASSPAHTTEGSNEYSVVGKSASRNKAAKNIKVAEPETEGAAYAQVQKPKPSVKPKTSTKPSSDKDVKQRGATDDDEYHTLSHTRGSPHTQDQADLESHYSHIGHD